MTTARSEREPFEVLTAWLEAGKWDVERVGDDTAYKASKEGELCPLIYYFQLKEELEQFLFYIVPDITLMDDMVAPVAEFVCRANYGMRIGNFELDFESRRMSFKSSVNFKGAGLSPTLLDNVVEPALTAFDEFFPAAAKVIAGIVTPAKAIRQVEYDE